MKMNPRKLYHSWHVNRNEQNKPYVTLLHLQWVIIFSTWSKLNLVFLLNYLYVISKLECKSRCMPKNLMFSVTVRAQLLYTMFNGQVRSLEEANFTTCILFKFSTYWLFWNHLDMQQCTECSLEFSSLRSLEETRILGSSAKRMVWDTLWCMANH